MGSKLYVGNLSYNVNSSDLEQLYRDPKRNRTEMHKSDEQRISRRPDKGGPAVRRAPVPIFGRAQIPERVVLCRAPVDVFSVDKPKLENDENQQACRQLVTSQNGTQHRVKADEENPWRLRHNAIAS